MHGIAAEISQKINVLFENDSIDTHRHAPAGIAGHHAGRAAADHHATAGKSTQWFAHAASFRNKNLKLSKSYSDKFYELAS